MKPVTYWNALITTIGYFGLVHFFILLSVAFLRGTWGEMNFFRFLGVHLLYPPVGGGIVMIIASWSMLACCAWCVMVQKKKK